MPKSAIAKLLFASLWLGGCSASKPQTLPLSYEGTVIIDQNNAETIWIEWKQNGPNLDGTYRYVPSTNRVAPFTGEVKAVTGGDKLQLTLKVPPAAQASMHFPPEFQCDMKITQKSPTVFAMGGFLDFKIGDQNFHRLLTMISTFGPPTATPKP